MAVKKITLPDNSSQDIHDARITGVDSTPTASSTNVVTSGGVATALAGVSPKIYVGTCSTAEGTATKVVTVETFPLDSNDEPLVGTTIAVKFSETNSASSPKLNVNQTGAASIWYDAEEFTASTSIAGYADRYSFYVWDGTYWVWLSWSYDNDILAYNIRTNEATKNMQAKTARYRILFTSVDGTKWVPANSSTATNAATSKTVNQEPIDPFGPMVYYSSTTEVASGSSPSPTVLYEQHSLSLGHSFNVTNAALTLTSKAPVFVKAAPQSTGGAIIDSSTPFVQALPSTEDGKIYIYLGIATSTTKIEFVFNHPVYYYKSGQIRYWTNCPIDETLSEIETLLAAL